MNDLKENNIGTKDTKITRLPLTSDYVFKRIFAREENNSMLKDFLEAILNIHINKVEVKNPELTPNMADEKLGILDLKLDIDNERVVDVEMQVSNEHNIKERSSTYLSKLAAEQLKAKQNYKELKKIITINILKYNYLERNSYHSIARMKYEDTRPTEFVDMGYNKEEEEATNTFEMHFIELPKFKEKNPDCNTKLEQWLWLIDGSKEEKVEMSAKENEEIDKTVKELDKLSKDPDEIAKYEEREWSIMRYNVEMKTNRELGKKEGEARGRKEKEATNTFEMHFIELPKFKEKNPDCNTKLEQWLWLIDGSKEEKVEMSAKENEEINKTVKELNKLSKDPDEIAKYEEREWSIMRYNVEMETNREIGEKEGEARGVKIGEKRGRKDREIEIVKKLHSLDTPIEKIAEIVELSTEEVKKIIK